MNYCNSVGAVHFQCLSLVENVLKRPPDLSAIVSDSLKNLHEQIYLPTRLRKKIVQIINNDKPYQAADKIFRLVQIHISPNFLYSLDDLVSISREGRPPLQRNEIVSLVETNILPTFESTLDDLVSSPNEFNFKKIITLFLSRSFSQSQLAQLEKSLRNILTDAHPRASVPELLLFISLRYQKTPAIWNLLFAKAVNVDARDKNGRTPLHYAVMLKMPIIILLLIDEQADLNIQDSYGKTVLHYTIEFESNDCANILLSQSGKLKLELACAKGFKAIHCAATKGALPIFQALLNLGASVEASTSDSRKESFLHFAAERGLTEFVKEVLQYKKQSGLVALSSYINAHNASLRTAMELACMGDHIPVVRTLLEYQAEIPPQLLFRAVIFGFERSVQLLVKQTGVLAARIGPQQLELIPA